MRAHVATIVPAFLLSARMLIFSRKGAGWHRLLGSLFPGLMPSSPVFGMSPTQLFIPFVLFANWRALDGALRGKIKQHQRWVMGLLFGALAINGVNNVFFLRGAKN